MSARPGSPVRPDRAGVFLDFDGTLSPIAPHPDLAGPAPGAQAVLRDLVQRFAVVAIVSGRPSAEVRAKLPVPGLEVFGLYGMEGREEAEATARMAEVARAADAAAGLVAGAWVERKGPSLAVHYRAAPDPQAARSALLSALEPAAAEHGLVLLEGKRVVELAAGVPSKGVVVERTARDRSLESVLYAGDDEADLDAFDALDRLSDSGVRVARVAVAGAETVPALLERADLVVDGPEALIGLLADLAGG